VHNELKGFQGNRCAAIWFNYIAPLGRDCLRSSHLLCHLKYKGKILTGMYNFVNGIMMGAAQEACKSINM
jgi:hypothetical protein